ncbi:MAG: alpha/beta hydrolase [Acidimicrobiales bacterium]
MTGLAMAERRVADPEATIICVHGGLDRGGSFARLARRIERFDVVAYDRRGYQSSRDLQPSNLEGHVDDLVAIARLEGARRPVILFGHSFGGVVALGAAIAVPSLAQLVLLYESPLPWLMTRERSRPPLGDDPGAEAERFFNRMVSASAWERLSESERESRRRDGPALLSDLRGLNNVQRPFEVSELTTPVIYLHGDGARRDYYRELCATLTRLSPHLRCREIESSGHGAHLAQPDLLATVITEEWDRVCA